MNKTPKVSVCVLCYNQEKYIGQALQSILDQQTSFDFEVIVGDDGSTDGSAAILREFAAKYPAKVKLVLQEKNVGPTQNYLAVHNLARGKYVAHMDGDDYCLPGKLERLATHLDENPECVIVWHRMHIINEQGESTVGMPVVPIREFVHKDRLYAEDLAKYYGMTGCQSGSMYRVAAKKIRARNEETFDYFFTMSFCIDGGYASYIDEPYGVYRFFANETTLTKVKGNLFVGKAKLALFEEFLASNPELAKAFAAQCLFDFFLRVYFRQPLKMAYLKMFFRCRATPSLSDLLLIVKIFDSNRRKTLARKYVKTPLPGLYTR